MGWLFYTDRRVQTYADEKAEIARLCTFETDTRRTTLVKASKVGSTWYAAAKVVACDAGPLVDRTYVIDNDGTFTFGALFLTRYDDGCWGYTRRRWLKALPWPRSHHPCLLYRPPRGCACRTD